VFCGEGARGRRTGGLRGEAKARSKRGQGKGAALVVMLRLKQAVQSLWINSPEQWRWCSDTWYRKSSDGNVVDGWSHADVARALTSIISILPTMPKGAGWMSVLLLFCVFTGDRSGSTRAERTAAESSITDISSLLCQLPALDRITPAFTLGNKPALSPVAGRVPRVLGPPHAR